MTTYRYDTSWVRYSVPSPCLCQSTSYVQSGIRNVTGGKGTVVRSSCPSYRTGTQSARIGRAASRGHV
eukprot:scaffold211924_cov23-Prasinocladus_malaysianus.AAC.1